MHAMGLTDRLGTSEHDGIHETNINYSEVHERTRKLLKSSKDFLQNALQ